MPPGLLPHPSFPPPPRPPGVQAGPMTGTLLFKEMARKREKIV